MATPLVPPILFLFLSSSLILFIEANTFCSRTAASRSCANPPTIDNINLVAYLGLWYEIGSTASFKLVTESGLVCDQAQYSSTAGKITLINSGLKVINPLAVAEVGAVNLAARAVCAGAREVCYQLEAVSEVSRALKEINTTESSVLVESAENLARSAEAAGLALQGISDDVSQIQQSNGQISQANSSLKSSVGNIKGYVNEASKDQGAVSGLVGDLNKIRARVLDISHKVSKGKTKHDLEQASLSLSSIALRVGASSTAMEVGLKAIEGGSSALLLNGQPIEDGQVSSVNGNITQPNATSAGKLEVSINGVRGPYWIIALEGGNGGSYYSAALVYSCSEVAGVSSKSLFILSREPQLDSTVVDNFLAKAESLGIYNDCEDPFLFTIQRGGGCGKPST